MFDKLINREINAELIAALIFAVASGLYLSIERGIKELFDVLVLWMFPASIMVFLTLVLVKVIEKTSERRTSRYRYVDWRKR